GGCEGGQEHGALVTLEERVEGSDGRTELPAAEERDGEGPAVRDRDGDPLARADPALSQALRERVGAALELGVCQRAAVPEERGLVRSTAGGGLEAGAEAPGPPALGEGVLEGGSPPG